MVDPSVSTYNKSALAGIGTIQVKCQGIAFSVPDDFFHNRSHKIPLRFIINRITFYNVVYSPDLLKHFSLVLFWIRINLFRFRLPDQISDPSSLCFQPSLIFTVFVKGIDPGFISFPDSVLSLINFFQLFFINRFLPRKI